MGFLAAGEPGMINCLTASRGLFSMIFAYWPNETRMPPYMLVKYVRSKRYLKTQCTDNRYGYYANRKDVARGGDADALITLFATSSVTTTPIISVLPLMIFWGFTTFHFFEDHRRGEIS